MGDSIAIEVMLGVHSAISQQQLGCLFTMQLNFELNSDQQLYHQSLAKSTT